MTYSLKGGNVARWQRDRPNPLQRTPDGLFRMLNDEFGFTLDAASSDLNAKCEKHYTREQDGLGHDWGTEHVWVNPPFGRGLREWTRKAWEASRSGALVVMLLPCQTDVDWWHDYVLDADEIRFVRGRPYFQTEDGLQAKNAWFPIAIVVFRPRSTGERVSLPLVAA